MVSEPDRPARTGTAAQSRRRIYAFSTCPESRDAELAGYRETVRAAARTSEEAGCFGMLIYTENRLVDPWLVAQIVAEATDRLVPLVAVQPAYTHPYTVAKLVSSLTNMYRRPIHLNLVAGGFRNDLIALGDRTEHDDRYLRLDEYAQIIDELCRGNAVSLEGRFYSVAGLRLFPPVPAALRPGFMVSGSSAAGLRVAAKLKATAVRYPLPPGEENEMQSAGRTGIRVGIIARDDREDAWRVALETFPRERAGQVAHGFAMKASDSHWHHRLSSDAAGAPRVRSPYWLEPFRQYQTFCPYLVGSYTEVADELARYIGGGADTVILDIPAGEEELRHGLRSVTLASSR
jgi:alkanesulfonate monooxygenase